MQPGPLDGAVSFWEAIIQVWAPGKGLTNVTIIPHEHT